MNHWTRLRRFCSCGDCLAEEPVSSQQSAAGSPNVAFNGTCHADRIFDCRLLTWRRVRSMSSPRRLATWKMCPRGPYGFCARFTSSPPRTPGIRACCCSATEYVRGVTYGTFRPDDETDDFPRLEAVAEDFAAMAANGINAVRTYTIPPHWLLD